MEAVSNLFNIAQIELVYKRARSPAEYPVVTDSLIAFQVLRSVWDNNKIDLVEEFKIILLDHGRACLGVANIASGGFNEAFVDPKLVFAAAVQGRASSIILAHNHTSDRLEPSAADIKFTRQLVACGKIMNIEVADHLIINRRRCHSILEAAMKP